MKVKTAKPVRAPINMLRKSNTRSSRCANCEAHQRKGAFHHKMADGFSVLLIRPRSFHVSFGGGSLPLKMRSRAEIGVLAVPRCCRHMGVMTGVRSRPDGFMCSSGLNELQW